jgi:uncharacterized coiled-coil protein SlyX
MTLHAAIAAAIEASDPLTQRRVFAELLRELSTFNEPTVWLPPPAAPDALDRALEHVELRAENANLKAKIAMLESEKLRTESKSAALDDLKKTIATQTAMIAERHRHIDRLTDQNRDLRKKLALLKTDPPAPVPAPAPAQDNIADQPVPADDETGADDADGADANGPTHSQKQVPARHRVGSTTVTIGGFLIRTSPAIAACIDFIERKNPTTAEIVGANVAPNEKTVSVYVAKARTILAETTGGVIGLANERPSLLQAGRYRITDTRDRDAIVEMPSPGILPSVQSEGEAGSSPGQGDAAREAGEGFRHEPSQASSFVTPSEPGEGVGSPVDPAPVADDGRIARLAPLEPFLDIPPGKLIAVCVKTRRIATPEGTYKVDGAPLAKALHALSRINDDQVLGLDQIARVAGWKNADVAKKALGFEATRLKSRGVELWMDRFHARLRAV